MTAANCFKRGTRILTAEGYRPIEDIAPGALAALSEGGFAPVLWVGRREITIAANAEAISQIPIRIKANALALNVPDRDLCVSPAHAMLMDGKLVKAIFLLNGDTVVPDPCERVEYFHIECERHVAIIAENAPCESFYPSEENRRFFVNHDGPIDVRGTPPASPASGELCAPVATGEDVAAIRERLWRRALELKSAAKAA